MAAAFGHDLDSDPFSVRDLADKVVGILNSSGHEQARLVEDAKAKVGSMIDHFRRFLSVVEDRHVADGPASDTAKVLEMVAAERKSQDANWGPGHDDQHSCNDWVALITKQLGEVVATEGDLPTWQSNMVAAAALAVAAAEAAGRHMAAKGPPAAP